MITKRSRRAAVGLAFGMTLATFAVPTASQAASLCGGQVPTITGGPKADTITGTNNRDVIWAGDGNDTVYGNGGNDVICGGKGADTLLGGAGNDTFFPGGGKDTIDGGAPYAGDIRYPAVPGVDGDWVDYSLASGGMNILLEAGNAWQKGTKAKDKLTGIENARGSSFADDIYGTTGINRLHGEGGKDIITGNGTSGDYMIGGGGIGDVCKGVQLFGTFPDNQCGEGP